MVVYHGLDVDRACGTAQLHKSSPGMLCIGPAVTAAGGFFSAAAGRHMSTCAMKWHRSSCSRPSGAGSSTYLHPHVLLQQHCMAHC